MQNVGVIVFIILCFALPSNIESAISLELGKKKIINTYSRGVLSDISVDRNITSWLNSLPGLGYFLSVGLGTPLQRMELLVDTGSTDMAVASHPMDGVDSWFESNASQTLQCDGSKRRVHYAIGWWFGRICTDRLKWANVTVASKDGITSSMTRALSVTVSLIYRAENFFLPHTGQSWNGIVGMAFQVLSAEPIHPKRNMFLRYWDRLVTSTGERKTERSVRRISSSASYGLLDSMLKQWNLPDRFGLLLCGNGKVGPAGQSDDRDSRILLGMEESNETVLYTPIRRAWYYEIVITQLLVDKQTVVADCKELNFDKTIVDSGTTTILLPARVHRPLVTRVQSFVQKHTLSGRYQLTASSGFWKGTSVICVPHVTEEVPSATSLPFSLFPPIEFHLMGEHSPEGERQFISAVLSPQQYVRYVETIFADGTNNDCYTFGIAESSIGTTLGSVFMEGFLVIFDREKLRVGFANSTCSNRVTSSMVTGPHKYSTNPAHPNSTTDDAIRPGGIAECAFHRPVQPEWVLLIGGVNTLISFASLILWSIAILVNCIRTFMKRV